jgi:RNA-directed DNA polymerase
VTKPGQRRVERRGRIVWLEAMVNPQGEELLKMAKPYEVSKQVVWEAWKRVKANRGAAGVDEETIQGYEVNLKDNLYKLWNRMSSGSYFPPPVRTVEIPKKDGGRRALGIPTVSDRIAQAVVKQYLEPQMESKFHPDSYGYRPNKSALDAVGVARKRCWRYDWVLDLDIKGYFDNIDHDLLMRAVRRHTESPWILMYVERWLKAPTQQTDETRMERSKGTPQGGVLSPLLANLFLHYAFDEWMRIHYPQIPFERYADDAVVHCRTEMETQRLKEAIGARLADCKLELHPGKTRIVYCKDEDRKGSYPEESFDFLGYTFRARRSKNRWGKHFINFSPAISDEAAKEIRHEMRRWRIQERSDKALEDLSHMFNPVLRGWINYYSRYYKSALYPTLRHFNRLLVGWATRKYKRLRGHRRRAEHWLGRVADREPDRFAHWRFGLVPATGQ